MYTNRSNSFCNWSNKLLCYCLSFILFIIGLLFIIQLFFIPKLLENKLQNEINKKIVMREAFKFANNKNYKQWVSNNCSDCTEIFYSYYMYNITNYNNVIHMNDEPEFEELGPFVHKYYFHRTNVEFINDSSEVSYNLQQTFIYDYELSVDINITTAKIYTISPAMLGLFVLYDYTVPDIAWTYPVSCSDSTFETFPIESLFYHSTIDSFLYGIKSEYIENNCSAKGATFYRVCASGSMNVIEKTGLHNISEMREMSYFRNFTYPNTASTLLRMLMLTVWENPEYVAGSRQMGQFPPNHWVSKNGDPNGNPLNIWGTEKYRKVPYVYRSNINYKGLDLLRFGIQDTVWMNMSELPTNKNYRQYSLPSGVINMSNVRGTPVFLSKGHFYNYPYYEHTVNQRFNVQMADGGMNSIEDDQYFDIDPISGIAFHNYHTFQINFRMIFPLRNYSTSFTRANISWWDEIVPFSRIKIRGMVQDKIIEEYVNSINTIYLWRDIFMYGGPIIFILFIGCAIAIVIKVKKLHYLNEKYIISELNLDDDNAQSELMQIPAYTQKRNEGVSYQTFKEIGGGF